jgi:hypothetical protein
VIQPNSSSLPARPRGVALEQCVEIDAPADVVWEVLADIAGWGEWNPVYPEASGSIGKGDAINLTIALAGMKPQKSSAKVFHSIPGQALQFGASAFGGLVHATRYIEIERIGPASCMVVNGEAFARLLGSTLVRMVGQKIDDGLGRQNAGLKAAAEARWRERTSQAPEAAGG